MDPIIDEVDWYYLSALPRGIRFDEETGTFTGTPRTIGEYTIPIKVETNYGVDTKDVKIIVEGTPHPVYAIGYNAQTWSNNAEADEYGFYPLPIANAHKLSPRYQGFTATVNGGDKYYAGVSSVYASGPKFLTTSQIVKDSRGTVQLICGEEEITSSSNNSHYRKFTYTLRLKGDGKLEFDTSYSEIREKTSTGVKQYINVKAKQTNTGFQSGVSEGYKLPEIALQRQPALSGIVCLVDNGESVLQFDFSTSETSYEYSVHKTELGYRAIKIFAPVNHYTVPFSYLSENYYLDNDPSKFRIGNIKDAWATSKTAYVQTDNNNLYSYYNGIWQYEGSYDIKKLEIPFASSTFILTTSGQLFHKGTATAGFIEQHDAFTQILPECSFYDFTVGGDSTSTCTLTVLRD